MFFLGDKKMEKAKRIEKIFDSLVCENIETAKSIIEEEYPFTQIEATKRKYTDKEKMKQFMVDGFIDRYSGEKLVNPGVLKVLSNVYPEEFPYHAHWKMECCHNAYWELIPTLDHIIPVATGGNDDESNWATTSMLHNSIKNNWTLEQLNWKLYSAGDSKKWDGLTREFVDYVSNHQELLEDAYIKRWYKVSKEYFE